MHNKNIKPEKNNRFPFLTQLFLIAILAAASLVIYSNTFHAPFILDDYSSIVDNPDIRLTSLTLGGMNKISDILSNRALPLLTFSFNYYFHQYSLPGYHAVNILIHILNSILLFFFCKITLQITGIQKKYGNMNNAQMRNEPFLNNKARNMAFGAALIWLVHPLHTNSVTYIVQRMNSMAALFYLLSLLLYIKGRMISRPEAISLNNVSDSKKKKFTTIRWKRVLWFSLSFVSCAAALNCKQNAAFLPITILLYEFYFFRNFNWNWLKQNQKLILLPIILLTLIAALYLGSNPIKKLSLLSDFSKFEFTYLERVLTQPRVVIYYLSLFFFPHPTRLNMDYDFPLSSSLIHPLSTLFAFCGIILLVIAAIKFAKKEPVISFSILWFLGNLIIESSFIPLAIIFEHRTYLPTMLISLSLIIVFQKIVKHKIMQLIIFSLLVIFFSIWTYQRNNVWSDEILLWKDCIDKSPEKSRPHNNLGKAYHDKKENDKALEFYEKSLQLDPGNAGTLSNIGSIHLERGDISKAMLFISRALQMDKTNVTFLDSMGFLFYKQKLFGKAMEYYSKVLEINPKFENTHYNLGLLYQEQGSFDLAVSHFINVIELNPFNDSAYNNLGVIFFRQGLLDKALQHLQTALRINPENAEAHNNIGSTLKNLGKLDEAANHFSTSLQLSPDYAEAHSNLGNVLEIQGDSQKAIQHYNRALEINPELSEAHNSLGAAYFRKRQLKKAILHYKKALDKNPDLAEIHKNLGDAFLLSNNIEEAILQYKKTLTVKPGLANTEEMLQKAIDFQNETNAAIEKSMIAMKSNPGDPVYPFQIANLYNRIGKKDKAILYYEKSLAVQPDFMKPLNALVSIYIDMEDYKQATTYLEKMIEIQPGNAGLYYNVACLSALQGEIEKSVSWLQKAIDRGYTNWHLVQTDKDLDMIRNTPGYKKILDMKKPDIDQ